ncbi:hypothetical protein MMU07_02795 [Aquiflexum sp. LQ15W]|uniref:hypothetical protein n=1 Tax=Cognataquiflexum nitidum TaxID=2922272 RepID=UPI001F143F0F|nr:hypothetical protein [Cognataquiflexum nitidum]MCH6198493.1 hypothetical protein [Cognataquiflexum nitidum]
MENRLSSLLKKYWEGETSLEEEREIKNLLQNAKDFEEEKKFFLGIAGISSIQPKEFELKNNIKKPSFHWIKIAALFIIFLAVGAILYRYQMKKAEREAFEQVMEAFNLIQTNMQKGTENLGAMGEMRHLNTTQEIFNLKEQKQ